MRVDFRLSRGSFHALMAILGTGSDHGWGPVIEALVFLFWLASGTSYRVVSRAFAMPRTTVHRAVHKTSRKVLSLLPQVVRLPTEEDFPHVGSIDGCHVRVTPPAEDAACYLNRKIFYSVQFQAVCDHTAKFIDVFIGFSGSAHDARVLKNSPLYYQHRYPPPGFCLIGDGGYPCLRQPIALMTPYRQPVHNNLQVRFNSHLSRARCVVERAFGILKTRWRSIFLRALEVDVLYVREVIACCTVLHNICLTNGDLLEPEADVEGDAEDHPQPAPQGAICGAEDRLRMAMMCLVPDHNYA
ncbi:protein ALP1-like [Etheostoma cragini]|uniref:protein ALP1-like n=1 Tax=Etheostoma cragini TaxID=417921 RepID=UPI00155EA397|nr:protein ALP1-like [Etheostoma cragini]